MAYDENLAAHVRAALESEPNMVEKKMFGAPFDITGRAMKGWVMVAPAGVASDENLQQWVKLGVGFAHMLPPK